MTMGNKPTSYIAIFVIFKFRDSLSIINMV